MPQLHKVLLFHTKNLIPKEGENLAQRHTQVKQDLRNLAGEDILRTKSRGKDYIQDKKTEKSPSWK